MKTILIFPPVWHPVAPHLAIPTLMGQLIKEGIDVEALDLNVEFYNDILKKSYLNNAIKNLKQIEEETTNKVKEYKIEDIENYPIEIKELLLKSKTIKEYLKTKSHFLTTTPKEVEKAVKTIKNKKEFYKPEALLNSSKTISSALEIASLPYAPTKLVLYGYNNPLFQADYESIKHNVFSSSTNIFIEYYKKWIPKILKKKAKLIGISIGSISQIIPALTLANLLKTQTDAHITIGGNYFSRTKNSFINHPDFFDTFADSVLYDEGEIPLTQLAKSIDTGISLDEIPNLIHKKDNKVIINNACKPLKLYEIPKPVYKGFDFSKYITPSIVLLLETNRGCYWSKCAFCDIPHGKKYSSKNLDSLIEEIKEYKKKYGVTHFEIIDESIPPKYYEKMAEKIIKAKLNINYYSCGRTEGGFTQEILHKLRASGLRMVLWGIESGSKRVLKLLNKGVDIEKRFEMLKLSAAEDIWNHAYAFFGFPTETYEEAMETIQTLDKHSDILHSCGITFFELTKNSLVEKKPDEYGIKNIAPRDIDFANILDFEGNILSKEDQEKVKQKCSETLDEAYLMPLLNYIPTQEYLFLYLAKYGLDWCKNYKNTKHQSEQTNRQL